MSTIDPQSTPATPTLAISENNLIWIDLEMTGLKTDSACRRPGVCDPPE
jgi:hypothetical protein